MIFTTGLCIYHSNLIKNNVTTKEEIKRTHQKPVGNPFYYNFSKNVKKVLFPPLSNPSLLESMRIKLVRSIKKIVNQLLILESGGL